MLFKLTLWKQCLSTCLSEFVLMSERETKHCLILSSLLQSHDAGVLLQRLFEQREEASWLTNRTQLWNASRMINGLPYNKASLKCLFL